MAGYVPNAWAARLLEATVGRTAITSGPVYLGLAFDTPEDPMTATLTNILEVNTPGYARVEVPAFNAAVTDPIPAITTPTTFVFPSLSEDMPQAAVYAFLCDVATGTVGNIRYLWELPNPLLGVADTPIQVPANTLIIE